MVIFFTHAKKTVSDFFWLKRMILWINEVPLGTELVQGDAIKDTCCIIKNAHLYCLYQPWKPGRKKKFDPPYYARQENCEGFLLAETNDPLNQQGAVRHRVGPKDHEFQLKKSQTCF